MKKGFPLISVVVPCFNSKGTVVKSIDTLLATSYPNFEVIIVDDVSTDGTYEIVKRRYSRERRIRLVKNAQNGGPARTRNHGISLANGKYIAFYETDMEADPNWLKNLVEVIERDRTLGAVQSKTLDINKRTTIHSLGVLYDPHTFWVYSPGCGYEKGWSPKSLELGIGSVGSLVKKSVIDKIGGFDEKLTHNIDDIEFGYRIWLCGYRCIAVPSAITYHWTAKPESLRAMATPTLKSEFHFHKTFRVFLKNYEWGSVLRYTPWLIFAYSARALYNFFKGNPNPAKAFVKAFFWNIWILPDTLGERSRVQKLRRRSDKEIFNKIGLKGSFFQIFYDKISFNILKVHEVFK